MLDGRVGIVTGAGSGIGREIALKLAAAGAEVVAADIDEAGGRETVARIEANGGTATFVRADASQPADHEALVAEARRRFGALHIAVNNAGIGGPSAPLGEYPLEGWQQVIGVNLSGVFYGMRYQLPAIRDAGGGSITNIASILGQVGFRESCAYVAAKHGVIGLTRNAALEYAADGIRVNAVGPGFIKTPMIERNLDAETLEALVAAHPIGRLGEASEVAELVLWLSSDKASFVTGSYYPIDGGYLAQ
jgi:NAD(P)-dependent dehydrogenase (short-subunit alcohol dehydrogenase family)